MNDIEWGVVRAPPIARSSSIALASSAGWVDLAADLAGLAGAGCCAIASAISDRLSATSNVQARRWSWITADFLFFDVDGPQGGIADTESARGWMRRAARFGAQDSDKDLRAHLPFRAVGGHPLRFSLGAEGREVARCDMALTIVGIVEASMVNSRIRVARKRYRGRSKLERWSQVCRSESSCVDFPESGASTSINAQARADLLEGGP